MPPAVDDEAGGADDIHQLIDEGLARQLSGRKQQISEQDEQGSGPAHDFDEQLDGGQASAHRRSAAPIVAAAMPGKDRIARSIAPRGARLPISALTRVITGI